MTSIKKNTKISPLFPLVAILFHLASIANACSDPVFQYALERWMPDMYEIIVATGGHADGNTNKLIDGIRWMEDSGAAEIAVKKTGDLKNGDVPAIPAETLESIKIDNHPFILIHHSRIRELIVFQGKLNSENIKALNETTIRREIRDKLLAGNAAVWLFLEGADQKLNGKRLATLRKLLKTAAEKAFDASKAEAAAEQEDESDSGRSLKPPVIIKFAIVKAGNGCFESTLLRKNVIPMIEGAVPKMEPLIIPVFGKGRALTVVRGDKLDAGTIDNIAYYVTGACSCEVKSRNPGIDLFIPLSWDSGATATIPAEPPKLPEITVPTIAKPKKAEASATTTMDEKSPEAKNFKPRTPRNSLESGFFKIAAISLGILVFIVIAGTLLMGGMKRISD
jgi:hypothetical protein